MKNNPIALLFPAAALAVATLAALHLISIVAATGTFIFVILCALSQGTLGMHSKNAAATGEKRTLATTSDRQWLNQGR